LGEKGGGQKFLLKAGKGNVCIEKIPLIRFIIFKGERGKLLQGRGKQIQETF